MRVERVHVRFYKAFNYDYLHKFKRGASAYPWEYMEDGSWHPFVEVPLTDSIATIVGANESGKSQLLSALEVALTGEGAVRSDFCRYSRFFVVEGDMPCSDFGVTVGDLDTAEVEAVAKVVGGVQPFTGARLTLIRRGTGRNEVHWLTNEGGWESQELDEAATHELTSSLPRPFWIDAKTPLPSSVPIVLLAEPDEDASSTALPLTRRARNDVAERLLGLDRSILSTTDSIRDNAAQISSALAGIAIQDRADPDPAEVELARDLLLKVAGIGSGHFADLMAAIAEGRDGYVSGIEKQINRALANCLNFRKWWSQDVDFQLRVAVRETDLAFVIRDRTGTDYSFSERSHGLRYFLSYFVQYLAHEPLEDVEEVLLMDEPDAYLSSQGQRDLLKVFDAIASPADGRKPCAVVYVTHSPFLIDRNHAERICVLEKGDGDEGTRVVEDAARNHYEPLRSAFGSYVAETTFMGSCNLMVEGPADQILLAGLSTELLHSDVPRTSYLDLNEITIVPAGGATHVPYLVYLARGRDVEKPAVIALLDGDQEGNAACRSIGKGGAYRGRLLGEDLILQLNDPELGIAHSRTDGDVELEDLIPADLGRLAGIAYACEFLRAGVDDMRTNFPIVDGSAGLHRGVAEALRSVLGNDCDLSKVGFARHVVDLIKGRGALRKELDDESRSQCIENFKSVLERLGRMQRLALKERQSTQLDQRVTRITESFLADHPTGARRVDVQLLFEELFPVLDDSPEAEDVRENLRRLERVHGLNVDLNDPIDAFAELRDDLRSLPYLGRQASAVGVAMEAANSDSAAQVDTA